MAARAGAARFPCRARRPVVTGFLTIDTLLAGDYSGFADALWHLALPAFVLGWAVMGIISRLVRASMLDVLSQDYVLMARAKGAGELRVLFNHALRNALMPTLTVIGFSFAYLITGAVLTETIFSWPGIGSYAVDSARVPRLSRDHGRHHRRRRCLPADQSRDRHRLCRRRSEDQAGMSAIPIPDPPAAAVPGMNARPAP